MSYIFRKILFAILIFHSAVDFCTAQENIRTQDLFHKKNQNYRMGQLVIDQDPGIDTLINRHILYSSRLNGLEGFRIQIYNSSARNAREESAKIRAEFMNRFPDITSYSRFDAPGYYKIRAGDFRTKTEGSRYLVMIRKSYPDAYLVPDIINFPDQINK